MLAKAAEIVDRGERHRRRAELELLLPATGTRALLADQQPAGAHNPRDPTTNANGGRVPRLPVGADAGGRPTPACRGNQV